VSRRRLWRSCRPKEWVRRLRALAADAHHCIMVGSLVHRIEAWHDCSCTHMRAPLRHRHPDTLKYAVVLGAIKDKALRVALRAILDRSCARRPLRRVGRDMA
jgi:hypothetical protein